MIRKLSQSTDEGMASQRHRGAASADLLVASALVLAMIGTTTTTASRSLRLRAETRQQQVALDELSNQLELLVTLDEDSLAQAIDQPKLSPQVVHSIPGAALRVDRLSDEQGDRLVATIDWQRRVPGKPVKLVAWRNSVIAAPQEPKP